MFSMESVKYGVYHHITTIENPVQFQAMECMSIVCHSNIPWALSLHMVSKQSGPMAITIG